MNSAELLSSHFSKTCQQIRDLGHLNGIGYHSHIRGLGISPDGSTVQGGEGLVGQEKARRAASIIVKMIRDGRLSGRAVLLAGKPGTGKTALATAMSQTLGSDVSFCAVTASELCSLHVSRAEALTQALRKAVTVRIVEQVEEVFGEVVEICIDRQTNYNAATQSMRSGKLTLRTTEMEAVYDLGQRMIDSLGRERVAPGDVIKIDKATGNISKVGRSYSRAKDFDATGQSIVYVATPEGELQRSVTNQHSVSLHDMDVLNDQQSSNRSYAALFSGDTGEIRPETRDSVTTRVAQWREEGKCQVVPGVLFIDEVHLLDPETFASLNRATEGEWSPLLVMASNRGALEGHGIPADLLDRSLIVETVPYNDDQVRRILQVRSTEEDVPLSPEALSLLGQVAVSKSLRYAMQLLITANISRQRRSAKTVEKQDVERVLRLFLHVSQSILQ